MPFGTASHASSGKDGQRAVAVSFFCLRSLLAALRRLGTELLREALDTAFGVEQLLPSREERVAVRADFEVQLLLGRPGLPGRAAGAAGLDVVVLRVDAFLHSELLGRTGKHQVYTTVRPNRGPCLAPCFRRLDGSGPVPPVGPERVAQPWRQPDAVADGQISLDVGRAPHARDGRRDRRVFEDEPERQLGQVHALGNQRLEPFDPRQGLRAVSPVRSRCCASRLPARWSRAGACRSGCPRRTAPGR